MAERSGYAELRTPWPRALLPWSSGPRPRRRRHESHEGRRVGPIRRRRAGPQATLRPVHGDRTEGDHAAPPSTSMSS